MSSRTRTIAAAFALGALLAIVALAVMALTAPNPADAPLWALGVIA